MSYMNGTMVISPRMRDRVGVDKIMLDVIIALFPALLMGTYLFGLRVLLMSAVSILSCMGAECLYNKARSEEHTSELQSR